MTSHLPSVPLPGTEEEEHSSSTPSPMAVYISTIELYRILDSILSDIYQAWPGRSSPGSKRHTTNHGRLDIIIELEKKLFEYLYLRLLLYRPILAQLCSEFTHPRTQADNRPSSSSNSSTIYTSILSKYAAACVRAAIALVYFVHETYQTSATDPWWYNGFWMVLIMSSSCRTILAELDASIVHEAWSTCEQILAFMSSFSVSARNTLLFLRTARTQAMAENGSHVDSDRNLARQDQGQGQLHLQENLFVDPNGLFLSHWDASADELELGFLGPFDYGEMQGWLGDSS
ncbi:activator of stress genes 1 [Aspergillus lentulus]|nr:activator of stress genes 1 [Aspergillus lentulus]